MSNDSTDYAAGLLSLKAHLNVLSEVVARDIAERKGQAGWDEIYSKLGQKYKEEIEKTLLAIGDANPRLSEALKKTLDETNTL